MDFGFLASHGSDRRYHLVGVFWFKDISHIVRGALGWSKGALTVPSCSRDFFELNDEASSQVRNRIVYSLLHPSQRDGGRGSGREDKEKRAGGYYEEVAVWCPTCRRA